MDGRRSYPRFSVAGSDGVFSVLREVAVRQIPTGELVIDDREPRQVGEVLTLETFVNGKPVATKVRVIASRPSVRDGNVFHELRLMPLALDAADKETR